MALTRLNAYIAEHNGRYSAVREQVLEKACYLPQPFTAEQLVAVCADDRISKGTIYNALRLFVKVNIVHAFDRQREHKVTEYEIVTTTQNRLQTVCEKCGKVQSFHDQVIERIIRERKYSNFILQHFTLLAYGQCRRCKEKQTQKTQQKK
jgi:Fe2+ or Zn2+ uptake regulation protein